MKNKLDAFSKSQLIDLNKKGLIPGPLESVEQFSRRISFCEHKKPVSLSLYKIEPDWLEVTFSNQGLMPWEGGCTFIDDQPTIQLRKSLEKRSKFLFYKKEEMIAHEVVHGVRTAFEEPIFEEILAYQTSDSWFRRLLGPIFRTPREAFFFVIILLLVSGGQLFLHSISEALIVILGMMGFGLLRITRTYFSFYRMLKSLNKVLNSKSAALACALHLTDKEIYDFGKMPSEEILSYVNIQKDKSLRWKQIHCVFFESPQ